MDCLIAERHQRQLGDFQQERVSGSVMTSSTLNTVAMSQPSVVKKPPNTKLRIFSTVRIDVILL